MLHPVGRGFGFGNFVHSCAGEHRVEQAPHERLLHQELRLGQPCLHFLQSQLSCSAALAAEMSWYRPGPLGIQIGLGIRPGGAQLKSEQHAGLRVDSL